MAEDMTFAVGVTTAPRRGVSYLEVTLVSLEVAGFRQPVVFAETERPMGPWPNFLQAVNELLSVPCDHAVIVQDDVLLARGCRDWLAGQLTDGQVKADVLSLYTAAETAEKRPTQGWFVVDGDELRNPYGACAIVLPRATAELLFDSLGRMVLSRKHVNGIGIDTRLGEFCRKEKLRYAQHVPSLVRHIGQVSSLPRGPHGENPPLTACRREGPFVADVEDLR